MLNRRLVVLFILFVAGLCILASRLGHLQFTQADDMRKELQASLMARSVIETARGSILDRNNIAIAFDKPSYSLAMDYRAMNLDDGWLARAASDRMKAAGEKPATKAQRTQRIMELKDEIKHEIDAIPAAIAERCDTSDLDDPSPTAPPVEKVLARFQKIREDIRNLRVEVWNFSQKPQKTRDDDFNRMLLDEKLTHTIIPHIRDEQAFYFISHAQEYPGLIVLDSRKRIYPYKDVACQVIGSMRLVDKATHDRQPFRFPNLRSDEDKGQLIGYRDTDLMGSEGVEAKKESVLHGSLGCRIIERGDGTNGSTTPILDDFASAVDDDGAASPDRRIDPVFGKDVQLTLDIELQKDIERAIADPTRGMLKGKDGRDHPVAMVVLSLDGQVLAMMSMPSYDLNSMADLRVQLNADQYRRPLANRALQPFRPGSTVKPLLAAAALSEKLITPQTAFTCNGFLFPGRPKFFRCDEVHGTIQLVDAIAHSCNIYFYNVGDLLGVQRLAAWYRGYGLGVDTGFGLPDDNGYVIDPAKEPDDPMTLRDEARRLGIGEGKIDVTPLQMANAYATLLRGGQMIVPRILVDEAAKVSQPVMIAPEVLAIVKEGMRRCATSGTAKGVFGNFRLPVGGKTGTADIDNRPVFDEEGNPVFDPERPIKNRDGTPKLGPDGLPMYRQALEKATHSWFIGYAPADRPKFVVVVVKEFGGYGATYAAPLVKEAFLQLEKHHYLPQVDVP